MASRGRNGIEEIALSNREVNREPELVRREGDGEEDDAADDFYHHYDDEDDDGIGDYMTPEAVDEMFLEADAEDEVVLLAV